MKLFVPLADIMNLIGYVDVSGGCIFEESFWVVLDVARFTEYLLYFPLKLNFRVPSSKSDCVIFLTILIPNVTQLQMCYQQYWAIAAKNYSVKVK